VQDLRDIVVAITTPSLTKWPEKPVADFVADGDYLDVEVVAGKGVADV